MLSLARWAGPRGSPVEHPPRYRGTAKDWVRARRLPTPSGVGRTVPAVSIEPGGSASTPRPLSARESGAAPDATLHEGLPAHLAGPLRRWANQFLASGDLEDRVAARLQIGPPGADAWWGPGSS